MRIMQQVVWPYRQATGSWRALPDFIILGAQKAGTSSLFLYLSQHPQLKESFKKEVHFFDGGSHPRIDAFHRGRSWYQAHFPFRNALTSGRKTFEASPLYLFHPLVPQRLHEIVPQVKLIALLRNPTERAISHYFHSQQRGREPLPIMDALRAEDERLAQAIEAEDYRSEAYRFYSYQRRGLYQEQLERYRQFFGPDQLLVLGSENFFAKPHEAMQQVMEFVGVDSSFEVKNLKPSNVTRNRKKVPAEVYDYLDAHFEPYHRPLYDMLGQDLGW